MNEHKPDKALDHEYDGIQEFDNPLPSWWLLTFYGTIIFSVIYVAYYHFGPGKSLEDELAQDMEKIKTQQAAAKKSEPGPSEENLVAMLKDPETRRSGQKVYSEKCASCHAVDGGGLIGPNLTDRHWIHGKGMLLDILNVVSEGVPDKGMPPWKALLKKEEVYSVVAYVKSLQGTKPGAPKGPQGTEIEKQ